MTMGHGDDAVAKAERDVLEAKKRLAAAMKARPVEPIKDYTLAYAGTGAKVALSQLFGASRELLVVHNMGKRCPYCTLWADGFSSMYKHVANRAPFVLTTPDDPATAHAFATARGWTFPVVSHDGTTFAKDMGYKGEDGKYGAFEPGISALWRGDDGQIVRTGTRAFGPGDDFCAIWPMMDLLKGGVGGWEPKYHY